MLRDKQKQKVPEIQDTDIMEEIRRLNEVTEKYSRLNKELNEMEEILPQQEDNNTEPEQWYQISEDVRSIREKLKMVKGDVSMADLEVQGHLERMKELERKRRKNFWRVLAVFEMVLMIALGAGFFAYIELHKGALETAKHGENGPAELTPTPDESVQPELPQTEFFVENLSELVAKLTINEIAPFTATVEKIDGMEYLCFTCGDIRICYANEHRAEQEDTYIYISNEQRRVVYPWDYDLTAPLGQLAPKYGSYTGEAGAQLIFLQYEDGEYNIPASVRMLDAEKLWEYDSFATKEELLNLFTLEYSEQASDDGEVSQTLMTMTVSSVPYTYKTAQSTYVNAVYYGENPLCFDQYFTLQLDEEKMSFSAVVYTPAQEYLGEISGELATVDREIVLKNVRYGAYVTEYQEDAESDGVITPRNTRMTEHITISGKNKERYYIALSDEIARVDYDMERLIMNESGFYEYFNEAGEKISYTGIDVSKYQADIDWKKVKAAGVDFAIVRLGYRGMNEGTLELDPYYKKNVKGANAAGIKVGVYFFSQAVSVTEAVEEARMVLEHIADYDIDYPVIFDTEVVPTYPARANNLPRDLRTDICIAFCDTIEAAGYRPMIYANTKWMIMGIDLERLTGYDKWYAYYGTNFTFPYHYDMLQYSESGKVPGVSSAVDLDISFKDYSRSGN